MRAAFLFRVVFLGVLLCGMGLLAPHLRAQSSPMPSVPQLGRTPAPPLGGADSSHAGANDPLVAQQEARRVRAAMDERQRKMQDDTAKLLKLAEELKAEMEKTNKFQMSVEAIRKAEEIEKLARDVKNRMRG